MEDIIRFFFFFFFFYNLINSIHIHFELEADKSWFHQYELAILLSAFLARTAGFSCDAGITTQWNEAFCEAPEPEGARASRRHQSSSQRICSPLLIFPSTKIP
jgi:hypothetical protein